MNPNDIPIQLLASVVGDVVKVGYYAGLMVGDSNDMVEEDVGAHCGLYKQESIHQFVSLISVMYWSRTSDHIGRKPILLLGTFALAVSTYSFGLSSTFWGLVVRSDSLQHLCALPHPNPPCSRCVFKAFNSNAGEFGPSIYILEHS